MQFFRPYPLLFDAEQLVQQRERKLSAISYCWGSILFSKICIHLFVMKMEIVVKYLRMPFLCCIRVAGWEFLGRSCF